MKRGDVPQVRGGQHAQGKRIKGAKKETSPRQLETPATTLRGLYRKEGGRAIP